MKKYYLCILALFLTIGFLTKSPGFTQDMLEVVSVEPESPAKLLLNEKMHLTIRYRISSIDEASIYFHPYNNRQRVHHCTYSSSLSSRGKTFKRGEGKITTFFYFHEPAKVDEIRVYMGRKIKSWRKHVRTQVVEELRYRINARWVKRK